MKPLAGPALDPELATLQHEFWLESKEMVRPMQPVTKLVTPL